MAFDALTENDKKKRKEYIILALSSFIFFIVIYSSFLNPSQKMHDDYLSDTEVDAISQVIDLSILDFDLSENQNTQTLEVSTLSKNPFAIPSWINNSQDIQQSNTSTASKINGSIAIERSENSNLNSNTESSTMLTIQNDPIKTEEISNLDEPTATLDNTTPTKLIEQKQEDKLDATEQKDILSQTSKEPISDDLKSKENIPTLNDFLLSGTIIDGHNKSAIINGSIIYLNDTINGFLVYEIKPRQVILTKDKLTYKVDINE